VNGVTDTSKGGSELFIAAAGGAYFIYKVHISVFLKLFIIFQWTKLPLPVLFSCALQNKPEERDKIFPYNGTAMSTGPDEVCAEQKNQEKKAVTPTLSSMV
jgi:hypothetical protein